MNFYNQGIIDIEDIPVDFETYQQAIPQYRGIKPFEQIPFQYSLHINIDYDAKYKIKKEIEKLIYHEKNMKKFKDIKNSKKYMGNEMLSFICIGCEKEQRKGLKTFSTKEVFCNHCKV